MKLIASFIVAFSTYSKLPMPQKIWKDEQLRYVFIFFPFVGAVIGVLEYLTWYLSTCFCMDMLFRNCIMAALPLVVTGGIHVDGYMDTRDAFGSYQDKEKKLEIMKDPHVGGAAITSFAVYGLIYLACLTCIQDIAEMMIVCAGFVTSRSLCSLVVLNCTMARKTGMLVYMREKAGRIACSIFNVIFTVAVFAMIVWFSGMQAFVAIALQLLATGYVIASSKKQLGGINGDIAGYMVLLCELMTVVSVVYIR